MTMRKPLIIEFTGPPNSGKTTLIHSLSDILTRKGYSVEVKQEDAEIVPPYIPKKTWARNTWITCGQLQSLIENKYSNSDIIFLDRGFYDAIFWAEFLRVQNVCSDDESASLLRILKEMDKQFNLKPDYLFIIDVSTSVSLQRRYLANRKKVPILSTDDFINLYKSELDKFYPRVESPLFYLNTSDLSDTQVKDIVLEKVVEILKN